MPISAGEKPRRKVWQAGLGLRLVTKALSAVLDRGPGKFCCPAVSCPHPLYGALYADAFAKLYENPPS